MKYSVNTNELKKSLIDSNISTVNDLSVRTGINRNTLSSVLNGKSKPSSYVIEKLAHELALTPTDVGRIFFHQTFD